jgi:hypothetical protein
MSRTSQAMCPVPHETVRVARVAYPKGIISLRLRDHMGRNFRDEDGVDVYPGRGNPPTHHGGVP